MGSVHQMLQAVSLMLRSDKGLQTYAFGTTNINPVVITGLRTVVLQRLPNLQHFNRQLVRNDGGLHLSERWIISMQAAMMSASRPEDYIYGLLGLNELRIPIEYGKNLPLARLYGRYIACWFEDLPNMKNTLNEVHQVSSLYFISLAGLDIYSLLGKDDEEMFPTWAPALHLINDEALFNTADTLESYNHPRWVPKTLSDAPDCRFSLESLQLHVNGITIDRIAYISPEVGVAMLKKETMLELCHRIISLKQQSVSLLSSRPNGLMKVLFQATSQTSRVESTSMYQSRSLSWLEFLGLAGSTIVQSGVFKMFGSQWAGIAQSARDFVEWYDSEFQGERADQTAWSSWIEELRTRAATAKDGDTLKDLFISAHMMRELSSRMAFSVKYRRLFMTQKGLIGLGPYGGQVDDSVVLMNGSTLAHVLRPATEFDGGQKWLHVSPCFLPDLLNEDVRDFGSVESFFHNLMTWSFF